MLSSIKDKIKGWVAWVIVIIIVIPFALFGIGQYLNAPADVDVANIDGEKISKNQYLDLYEQKKSRYKTELGDNYDEKIDKLVKQEAIQELVRDEMLHSYAKQVNLVITDKELTEYITSLKDFQDESGQFSLEKFKKILRLTGLSEPLFETSQKKSLLRNQIITDSLKSNFTANNRQKIITELLAQERKFSYLELFWTDFFGQVDVDDALASQTYIASKDKFIQQRSAKVSYLVLSKDSVAKDIAIDPEVINELYEEQKQNLATQEERSAQHILLLDKVLAKEILAKINSGADFAKLASQYSEDTGSKEQGGNLGYFGKGVMVAEFEEAVFKLNKGQVSGLVQSEFGYHIILLNDIKAAKVPEFKEIEAQLIEQYKEERANEVLFSTSEELANAAYGDVKLAEVAKQFNLSLKQTDFFTEQDVNKEKILSAKFIKTAFSEAVYEKSENSNVIEPVEGQFIVMNLLKKTKQRQQTFAEVKPDIILALKQKKAKEIIITVFDKIKTSIESGQNKNTIALMKQYKLIWTKSSWIDRGYKESDISDSLRSVIFTMKKPKNKQQTLLAQNSKNGGILIRLEQIRIQEDIKEPAKAQFDRLKRQALSNGILQNIVKQKNYNIVQNQL